MYIYIYAVLGCHILAAHFLSGLAINKLVNLILLFIVMNSFNELDYFIICGWGHLSFFLMSTIQFNL